MIGAFARMLGARERLLAVEETEDQGYATRAQEPGRPDARTETRDAPPAAFVERVQDEGGDVYLAPMVEALRDWLRRRKADATTDARVQAGGESDAGVREAAETVPRSSDNG